MSCTYDDIDLKLDCVGNTNQECHTRYFQMSVGTYYMGFRPNSAK